jgi:enoyl-CoA hydratase
VDYETIIVEKRDNIAVMTFNRPEKGNRMNSKMVNELKHAMETLADEDTIRALIVRGEGEDFCCGWDSVEDMLNKSHLEILRFVETAGDSERMFLDFPKPTVAAVHGKAVMSGAVMAALADITIMADDAEMGFTAINAGLRQIVGDKKALELMITGRIFNGEEAERLGLATRVVSQERLFDTAIEVAEELASKSPLAATFTKWASAAVRDMNVSEATKFLNEHFTLLAASEDGQEALRARVTGDTPKWKNR